MKITVYLDNCAYNRPFDDQRQMRIFLEAQAKLHIQHLITAGEVVLACSYMSIYENSDNPHEERRFSIAGFFNRASLFVDHDKAENVETKAAKIMEQRISNKDAIHIACAIEAGCDYFITTDDNLIRKYADDEIIICNPVDFIKILEGQDE
jgi:predicted nucleic acid-binding protein